MLTSVMNEQYIYWKDYNDIKHVLKEFLTPTVSEFSELSRRDIFRNSEIKQQIIKYCLILKKFLINCKTNNICNNSKGCWYINYWLNDKTREIYDNLDNTIFDIYNRFIIDDGELSEKNMCTSKIHFIENDIFNVMKNLYGLYEIYDNVKTSDVDSYFACYYAKSCVDEYNKNISNCVIRDNNNFCEALDNLNSVFKDDEWISKDKCNATIPKLLSPQEAHDLLQEKSQNVHQHRGYPPAEEDLKSQLQETPVAFQAIKAERNIDIPTPRSAYVSIIIPLLAALVGIFLLFLYLYKFTPFGQWLSSRQGTIRISQNINNEMYDLQEHSSEDYQTNLEHIRCNVAYQSIGDI
ncbi:PIR protein [Plasmodium ovale]|uniref:PIR protein n=1 Tax=Plasmodium ovale TaxID=36330 RepID=A0A1D3JG67_PLAOA|nr:PIR protein [Plasmodium ovale]